jgi:hypothetical protein
MLHNRKDKPMRTVQVPSDPEEAMEYDYESLDVGVADHKDADEIFKGFDRQLERHGLQVVLFDTGGDAFVWGIERRRRPFPRARGIARPGFHRELAPPLPFSAETLAVPGGDDALET